MSAECFSWRLFAANVHTRSRFTSEEEEKNSERQLAGFVPQSLALVPSCAASVERLPFLTGYYDAVFQMLQTNQLFALHQIYPHRCLYSHRNSARVLPVEISRHTGALRCGNSRALGTRSRKARIF
ncbi:hypothetical protein V5799_005665 [Amblyomma americanum]|uniref:Uncharacterized protein n=1 Tax=Amblyomma americanum TaxID=6943 RepID=A0AAQ4DYL5_AMBAM